MCQRNKRTDEADLRALYDVLEGRYGLELAQQIVDEIRKVENPAYVPDYLAVKAVSEVVEFTRPLARESLKILKKSKLETSDLSGGVESLWHTRARRCFVRHYGAYRLAEKAFREMFRRAMDDIQKKQYVPVRYIEDTPRLPEKAMMAA